LHSSTNSVRLQAMAPADDGVEVGAGGQPALTRDRLVAAALDLVQEEGIEGLSMRALADRLAVKAASLYWHVRDRGELLDLLADAILSKVPAPDGVRGWREPALRLCRDVETVVSSQRDTAPIVLAAPDALERSAVHARLHDLFQAAGLSAGEAHATATMMLTYVVLQPGQDRDRPFIEAGKPASIAIDSGSRGVTLRAGTGMDTLIRVPHDPAAAAPAVVHGETVVVRRLRGAGEAEIELNPANPWRIRVQGPTWNTRLDLAGLDIREIKLDSGAARVDCILPPPHGVVPIKVSGGVAGLKLHRPPGVKVVAKVSSGAVKVQLDAFTLRATVLDAHWESAPSASSGDHYALAISGGAVQVALDEDAPVANHPQTKRLAVANVDPRDAVSVLLEGVEARARHHSRS
jgi:AcrR family transcriptional regulator